MKLPKKATREAEEKARFEAERVQREKAEAEQREARLKAEKKLLNCVLNMLPKQNVNVLRLNKL